jgi:hypothetical protein
MSYVPTYFGTTGCDKYVLSNRGKASCDELGSFFQIAFQVFPFVIPAKAGIQVFDVRLWIPAFASCAVRGALWGMTDRHKAFSAQVVPTNWVRFFKSPIAPYLVAHRNFATPRPRAATLALVTDIPLCTPFWMILHRALHHARHHSRIFLISQAKSFSFWGAGCAR